MLTFLLMVSLTAWSVQEGLSGVMHISLPYPLIHLHTVSSPLVARGALYARRAVAVEFVCRWMVNPHTDT